MSRPTEPRRWFCRLSLLSGVSLLLIGTGLWQHLEVESIALLSARVDMLGQWMRVVRWFGILLFAVVWPRFLTVARERQWISEARYPVLLRARWRILAWLLAIELLLGTPIISLLIAR